MAQLPLEHISHDSLADMLVGETRYTVPWAMAVDEDWNCWLKLSFTAHRSPDGTVSLSVTRAPKGYVVAVLPKHAWRPQPMPDVVGMAGWCEVAEVMSAEIAPS